ncbi:hypothetical protein BC940DRAFT_313170 [Gongronella butleri]|nr:hypothetical protein BC940DRAFT_313170 [Gongronella butleri]
MTASWFVIRSTTGNKIVSCLPSAEPALRSQVYVTPDFQGDHSLWTWMDTVYLQNKANALVLDIRKGRLRMMEDTEICVYSRKEGSEARAQQWGTRTCVDDFGRKQPGEAICSLANDEWVLDMGAADDTGYDKLILFPTQTIDNDHQRWDFVPEAQWLDQMKMQPSQAPLPHQDDNNAAYATDLSAYPALGPKRSASIANSLSDHADPSFHASANSQDAYEFSISSRSSSSADLAGMDFPHGLMPAKRGSQSSTGAPVAAFKECHYQVYSQSLSQGAIQSDKSLAMAAAYETWRWWREKSSDASDAKQQDKARATVLSMARTEATKLLGNCHVPASNHQTVLNMTNRYMLQLYEQPSTSTP